MKAAELFVRCLESEGVMRIFGSPGEENIDGISSDHPWTRFTDNVGFLPLRIWTSPHEHPSASRCEQGFCPHAFTYPCT